MTKSRKKESAKSWQDNAKNAKRIDKNTKNKSLSSMPLKRLSPKSSRSLNFSASSLSEAWSREGVSFPWVWLSKLNSQRTWLSSMLHCSSSSCQLKPFPIEPLVPNVSLLLFYLRYLQSWTLLRFRALCHFSEISKCQPVSFKFRTMCMSFAAQIFLAKKHKSKLTDLATRKSLLSKLLATLGPRPLFLEEGAEGLLESH